MQRIPHQKLALMLCLLASVLLLNACGGGAAQTASAPTSSAAVETAPEPPPAPAVVSVFAGSLLPGYGDGERAAAQFVKPCGMCTDGDGLLVVDSYGNLLRRIEGGLVSTIAGSADVTDRSGYPMRGYLNGAATFSMLNRPRFAAVSIEGAVVFSDSGNNMVRVVDGGNVYLLAGTQEAGYRDGDYREAAFNTPSGVVIGFDGSVLVADTLNHCIRVISKDGIVSTLAGNPLEVGFRDGPIEQALFCEPNDIALGADGALYVVDKGNQRIRKIYDGVVSTVAGSGTETDETTGYIIGGHTDGAGGQARLLYPTGLFVSDGGVIYVADTGNNCIRAISPDGKVVTVAGSKTAGNVGGAPLDARFNQPLDLVLIDETLYISDSYNHAVRAVGVDEKKLFDAAE